MMDRVKYILRQSTKGGMSLGGHTLWNRFKENGESGDTDLCQKRKFWARELVIRRMVRESRKLVFVDVTSDFIKVRFWDWA